MQTLGNLSQSIYQFLWGWPMLVLLLGTHLFLTFRTRFIQKYIFKAIRFSLSRDSEGTGDVTQFGALTTALAATIGTGNIVGVATAITLGGPGAVFWMWLSGVFGIATKYSEALLAVKYRVITEDGTMLGGPMYTIERGLKRKWLAVLFALFTVIASFGIGNMLQANSLANLAEDTLSLRPWMSGLFIAGLTAYTIVGGIRKLARVCEKLVPFMAAFYIAGCCIILYQNMSYLREALDLILHSAFQSTAAAGGFAGATMRMAMQFGIARGLISNESGLGSAPIVAAAARTKNPVRQALVAATGTFWDTVVVCAMTGMVLVSTILRHPAIGQELDGAKLTHAAFDQIPVVGSLVLTVGLATFVFSTILGWSYYGERAVEYLVGKRGITPYRTLYVVVVFFGAITTLEAVWRFSDVTNAAMAVPNVIALIALSGIVVSETKRYLWDGQVDLVDIPADIDEIVRRS